MKPWEKYQKSSESGPWQKYQSTEEPSGVSAFENAKQGIMAGLKTLDPTGISQTKAVEAHPGVLPIAMGVAGAALPIPGAAAVGGGLGEMLRQGIQVTQNQPGAPTSVTQGALRTAAAAIPFPAASAAGRVSSLLPFLRGPIRQGLIQGAAAGAATSVPSQLAETGQVDSGDVLESAGGGAFLGGAIPAIAGGFKAAKAVAPSVLSKTTKVPPKAFEMKMADPTLGGATGTEAAIERRVGDVQNALVDARAKAGEAYSNVLQKLGIRNRAAEPLEEFAGRQPKRSIKAVAEELKFLRGKPFKDEGFGTMIQPSEFGRPEEKINRLLDLRRDIDTMVDFKRDIVKEIDDAQVASLKGARAEVNKLLDSIPKGKRVRIADQEFSKIAGIYDDLQKQLAQPGSAEARLERAFRADSRSSILVKMKDMKKSLGRLEKFTGKSLIKPLEQEMAARDFSQSFPKGQFPLGASTLLGAGAGASGMAGLMTGNPVLGAIGAGGTLATMSPKLMGSMVGAGARVGQALKPIATAAQSVAGQGVRNALTGSLVRALMQRKLQRETKSPD